MRAATTVALAVLMLSLAACSGGTVSTKNGQRYPDQVRKNFVNACTGQGAPSGACTCALQKLEAQYSLSDFIKIENDIKAGKPLPSGVTDAIQSCAQ